MFLVTVFAAAAAPSILSPAATPEAPAPTPAMPAALPALGPAPQDDEVEDGVWTGSVNVGGIFASGNTESTTFGVSADARMQSGPNRYMGKLFYNYTEDGNNNVTTQDNRGLELEYNRFFNDRLYGLAQGSYYVDEIIGLNARTTLGVGAGYQIINEEHLQWDGELGVSFVDEDFENDVDDNDFTAARLATGLDWIVNEQVTYGQDLTFLQSLDESDDYIITNDSRVSVKLSESMVASLQYLFNYDNTPPAGFDEDDHRFIATVGWTF